MSDGRSASPGASAELLQQLRSLGQSAAPAARSAEQEHEREARLAAHIDAQVAGLVRGRRQTYRRWIGVLAAAAIVVGLFGLRRSPPSSAVSIAQEPLSPRGSASATPPPLRPAAPQAVPSVVPARPNSTALSPVLASALPSASSAPLSTLAEENQLFKSSAEASRNGDVSGALAQLDKLLTLHPASPLAQTALVRKFRLLAKAGQVEAARREAERYLAAYPTGFAVAEAQALRQGSVVESAP